mmetsp:Transcript_101044/g.257023  ORF Transcript_101044/g.257023 Transcript_101044/m.257023 type:complete len:125 (+) Transcript_101044:76-450(+)
MPRPRGRPRLVCEAKHPPHPRGACLHAASRPKVNSQTAHFQKMLAPKRGGSRKQRKTKNLVQRAQSLEAPDCIASHFLDFENLARKASSLDFTDLMWPMQKSRETQCMARIGSKLPLPASVMRL